MDDYVSGIQKLILWGFTLLSEIETNQENRTE